MDECERALAQARSALDQAILMRDALDGQQRATEAAVASAQRSVRDAVSRVVQAEGNANMVLAQYVEARREVARLHEILSFLSSRNCLAAYWNSLPYFPPTAADTRWRAALAELESDAKAILPE